MKHSNRRLSSAISAAQVRQLENGSVRAAFTVACSALAALGCSSDYEIGDLSSRELAALADGAEGTATGSDLALSGLLPPPELSLEAEVEPETSSSVISAAGDLDGDGYGDLATRGYDSATHTEFVHVRYGGPRPADNEQAFNFAQGGARLIIRSGSSLGLVANLASAGDVDGDGYADLLVGLANCHPTIEGEGAYLLYGSAERLSGIQRLDEAGVYLRSPRPVTEAPPYTTLGCTFGPDGALGIGDFDGDGFDDFVLTDQRLPDATGSLTSELHLFYGRRERLVGGASWTSADARVRAPQDSPPAALGDVDVDGFTDVMIGASLPYEQWPHFALTGRAERLSGDVDLASIAVPMPDWAPVPSSTGTSVSLTGPDVDGDGIADLILANVADKKLYLFYGKAGLLVRNPDVSESEALLTDDLTGRVFTVSAGDRDGDGDSDLLSTFGYGDDVSLGSRTRVAFVGGSRQRFSGSVVFPAQAVVDDNPSGAMLTSSRFLEAVAVAGDLDGDGAGDLITSSSIRYPNGDTGIFTAKEPQLHIHYGLPGAPPSSLR